MKTNKPFEKQELSAQDLSNVSGGSYAPQSRSEKYDDCADKYHQAIDGLKTIFDQYGGENPHDGESPHSEE